MVSLSRHISSRERRLLIPSTFSAGDSARLYWVQAWSANRLLNYCKLAGSVSALRPLRLQLRAYVGGQISPRRSGRHARETSLVLCPWVQTVTPRSSL